MSAPQPFSLASALDAQANDTIATWVGEFLASRGSDNAALAAGLAQDRHWWLGPVQVQVDELIRLAGPEDDALCPIEPEEGKDDVESMEGSIERGWEPPPLLAQFHEDQLLLQDGNHRYEALVRAGTATAWVLVWFDDRADRDRYRDRFAA
jgi:hypothetical protein